MFTMPRIPIMGEDDPIYKYYYDKIVGIRLAGEEITEIEMPESHKRFFIRNGHVVVDWENRKEYVFGCEVIKLKKG